ncbi:Spx/MgsR family RNA polymerase-binding regulatory protein [Macrococcus armenti]|uniref:Spx/MgsR family RNA polymerase-binding regulatory protein n=1 Tax=Macrococcus armenti TaxID=2875764 RepID=UPI001CC9B576|nr:Spx/MgsR family RNA polymerase-binding regulatory protein [Macrococcus armenti]UBH09219.1 Spx/MgsR family RNA polymerase-binding regulatory protein [Macrococcus armenti]UBH11515.1 Spx/MgsR family RNA polymerase-binding regulatory protein [Macrococcus armenti]UBH22945.1 Spx/MgsR family RNA polymerase-binding regulatory protein [Macrococcus armenti]
MIKFYQLPNCTSCRKAAKFLSDNSVSFEPVHIVEHTPTAKEFDAIVKNTGVDVNLLFNRLGTKFKELNLKETLDKKSYEEKLELLASDGMLVKRPLAVKGDKITLGFKEVEYKQTWL